MKIRIFLLRNFKLSVEGGSAKVRLDGLSADALLKRLPAELRSAAEPPPHLLHKLKATELPVAHKFICFQLLSFQPLAFQTSQLPVLCGKLRVRKEQVS